MKRWFKKNNKISLSFYIWGTSRERLIPFSLEKSEIVSRLLLEAFRVNVQRHSLHFPGRKPSTEINEIDPPQKKGWVVCIETSLVLTGGGERGGFHLVYSSFSIRGSRYFRPSKGYPPLPNLRSPIWASAAMGGGEGNAPPHLLPHQKQTNNAKIAWGNSGTIF